MDARSRHRRDERETTRIRDIYDRGGVRLTPSDDSWLLRGSREWLASRARGETLEIGIGGGATIPHYPADVRAHRHRPQSRSCSPPRANAPRRSAERSTSGSETRRTSKRRTKASIRSCSASSCAPSPMTGWRSCEAARVLRPGGRLLAVEHVRSPHRLVRWLRAAMGAGGCAAVGGPPAPATRSTICPRPGSRSRPSSGCGSDSSSDRRADATSKSPAAGRRRSVAERRPGRPAGRLDQLDEHPVARPRMEERDRTFGSAPRRRVDELDAVDLEVEERSPRGSGPRSRRGGSPRPCSRGTDRRPSCRRSARRARSSTPPPRGTRSGLGRAGCRRSSRAASPSASRHRPSDSSSERTTSATWWTLPRRPMCSGMRAPGSASTTSAQRTLSR